MMLRPQLPTLPELADLEDDSDVFDPSVDGIVPRSALSDEFDDAEDGGVGFRAWMKRPDVQRRAWRMAERDRRRRRAKTLRNTLSRDGRHVRWNDAA